MNRLMVTIKKEWMAVTRTKKIVALTAMAIFFALFDPVMLKMTPYLLKEFSGVDLGDMIQLTQIAALIDFHQDIYQLYTIVLVIVASNTWSNEVKQRTLEIPISKGVKVADILFAKVLTYAIILNGVLIVAYSINYYYSGFIFGSRIDYYQVLQSALLMGLFYTFCIAFMITLSILLTNGPAVIISTLLITFGGPFLASLVKIEPYTPFGLLIEARSFSRLLPNTTVLTVGCVLALTVFIYWIGTFLAQKKEMIKYR